MGILFTSTFFAHGVELDVVLFNPVVAILGIPRTGLALDVLTMRLAQFSEYAISSSCSSQKLRPVSGHTLLWSITSQELSRSCSPSLTIIMKSGDTGGPVEVQYPASNFQWGGFDASSVYC